MRKSIEASFERPLEKSDEAAERERRAIELIEQSSVLKPGQKVELAAFVLGKKDVIDLGDYKVIESKQEEEKYRQEFSEESEAIESILGALGVYQVYIKELGIEDGILGFEIAAAKTNETLEAFSKAEQEGNDEEMGLLLGYPKTAAEAYGPRKLLSCEELFRTELSETERKELEKEGTLKFLMFKLSAEHWREELEEARELQALIKEKAPSLYEETMSSPDDIAEDG